MMVRCENGLKILPTRPRARGACRFMTSPLPTCACATTRSSTSRSWLFSALAIADSRHLRTSRAMRLRENSRSASAVATFLPRMSCASRLSFCGLTRSMRATAFASLSASGRLRVFLLIFDLLPSAATTGRAGRGCCRRCGRARAGRSCRAFGFAVRRMAVEHSRRRELSELVTNHLFGDQHRNVLLAVIDAECQPDELRQYGRAPAPDADHLVTTRCARGFCLLEQIPVDERAFPNRTCHDAGLIYLFLRAWRLAMMNLVVDLFLRVFLPLVGNPQGVTGCRPPEVRPSPPPCG